MIQGRWEGPVRRRGKSEHSNKAFSVSVGRGFGFRNVMRDLSGPQKTLPSPEEHSEDRKGRQSA